MNIEQMFRPLLKSPPYAIFTTTDPTTGIFGLCTCKWEIFVLIGDHLQPKRIYNSHYGNGVLAMFTS